MKKTNDFKYITAKNDEFIEKLSKMIQLERKYAVLDTDSNASYGECVMHLYDSIEKTRNGGVDNDLKALYIIMSYNKITALLAEFFDIADEVYDGELSKLFFDSNILSKKTTH